MVVEAASHKKTMLKSLTMPIIKSCVTYYALSWYDVVDFLCGLEPLDLMVY